MNLLQLSINWGIPSEMIYILPVYKSCKSFVKLISGYCAVVNGISKILFQVCYLLAKIELILVYWSYIMQSSLTSSSNFFSLRFLKMFYIHASAVSK